MKNRNSIYQGLSRASIGMLAACMALTACDKDQEFTPAMPEAKLINGITFKVSENLPLAIGMDSTIVFAIDAPEDLEVNRRNCCQSFAARYYYRYSRRYSHH